MSKQLNLKVSNQSDKDRAYVVDVVAEYETGKAVRIVATVDSVNGTNAKELATLFAAAPSLLAACEAMIPIAEHWMNNSARPDLVMEILQQAKAALAKAKGEPG